MQNQDLSPLFVSIIIIVVFALILICQEYLRLKKGYLKAFTEQHLLIQQLERTISDLETSNEEVFQYNVFIKRLASVIAHDIQSPLHFMLTSVSSMNQLLENNEIEKTAKLNKELLTTGKQTMKFVTDFSLWVKSLEQGFEAKNASVNLYELLMEINDLWGVILQSKRNYIDFQALDRNLGLYTDRELLKVVLRNFIDNFHKANKHAQLCVVAKKSRYTCNIILLDSGTGIPALALQKINEQLRGGSARAVDAFEERNGYKLISHFAFLLNIKVNIKTQLNKGTIIELENFKIACPA